MLCQVRIQGWICNKVKVKIKGKSRSKTIKNQIINYKLKSKQN